MTREEVIRILEVIRSRSIVPRTSDALLMAIDALNKENEPAPSANDTSSEENYPKNNDTTEKAKCQEAINLPEELIENLFKLVSDCERNIVTACIKYKAYDIQKIHQIVCATMKTALEMVSFKKTRRMSDE